MVSKPDIIVGCSGGPDSMALASLLVEMGFHPLLAHVNYHKRDTALRDEKIVEDFARSHGLVFEKADAPGHFEGNFQGAARDFRYAFFERLAADYGLSVLALAHHEDDLLETYLMQKKRNALVETYGLAPVRKSGSLYVIRPLLSLPKNRLELYCRERNIEFGIDESNLSDAYLRNQVRHQTVERLSGREKSLLLHRIKEDNLELQELRKEVLPSLEREWISEENAWFILGEILFGLDGRRRSKRQLEEHVSLLRRGKPSAWPGFILEFWQGHLLLIRRRTAFSQTFESPDQIEGAVMDGISFERDGTKAQNILIREEDFPVTVRSGRSDDRLAMRYGTKKLSRFFMDRRIPHALRESWPVVENGKGEVIFAAGLGSDKNHFSLHNGVFLHYEADDAVKIQEAYDIINFDFNLEKGTEINGTNS